MRGAQLGHVSLLITSVALSRYGSLITLRGNTHLPNIERHSTLALYALAVRYDRVEPVILVAAGFEQKEQIRRVTFLPYQDVAPVFGLEHVNDVRVERSVAVDQSRITTASGDGPYKQ